MVRECTEKDKEQLLAYLKEEAVYNTFLLADIEDFMVLKKISNGVYG